MIEYFRANELWIAVGVVVVMLLLFTIWLGPEIMRDVHERRVKKWQQAQAQYRRRLLDEGKEEREQWLAGALVHRNKAIVARVAREQAQTQKAAPQHPARTPVQTTGPTVPIPPTAPTVPLTRKTPEAPKDQQRTKPQANSAPVTAPLQAQTRLLPKPPVKRNATPRRAAPPGTAAAPWHIAALPGFRNLRIIGSGGFADVLYGEDKAGTPQAIKVLRKSGAEKDLAEQLFRREARMLAALHSPSIPRLISSHVDAQLPHFAMEYIDGVNLRDHVQANGAMTSPAELLNLANSTADGLAEIHESKFLHRDIKPLNVMASQSGFKLIDLGIGKDLGSHSTTSAGRMGTLAFMAPEYMNGEDATSATDVFSWGAMMGYAMTGMQPYGDHAEHVLMNLVREGHLDGRFLQALEDFKLLGVTHQMLAFVVGVAIRIDPAERDLNFREVLQVLKRLHRDPTNNSRPNVTQSKQPTRPQHMATTPKPVIDPAVGMGHTSPGPHPLGETFILPLASWELKAAPAGYRDFKVISHGGFADVLSGLSEKDGKLVAIKVLHDFGADDVLARQLFRREAQILSSSQSWIPNFVEANLDAPRPYIVMEYLEGRNLYQHVQHYGPILNPSHLEGLAKHTATALSGMHSTGYVHKDVQPSHVMVSPDGYWHYVIDPGIGLDRNALSTRTLNKLGTLSFAAPEYMMGADATPRTDLYSWGLTLGYAMTGRLPYGKAPEHILLGRVRSGNLDEEFLKGISSYRRGFISNRLADIVFAAINRDPELRGPTFEEITLELDEDIFLDPNDPDNPQWLT